MTIPLKRLNTLLISILVIGLLIAAFYWFQSRYIRSFDERAAFFSGDQLHLPQELAGPGPIRFVHVWEPACPCNIGNQQHLTELVEHYQAKGIAFYQIRKTGSRGKLPGKLADLPEIELGGSELIPASPAVGIWDQQGQLAYFGPYSEGFTCNADNSFIEPILEALAAGRPVRAANTLAVGCFCDWTE